MSSLPRTLIASGTFQVSGSKRELFEALLGSCVGVAAVDRAAGIGGLYHILLAEHSTGNVPFSEEIYASTGMPKFLRALYEKGCDPGRMEVTLAGGALIGKLSRLDMHLDVGGRTADVVDRILKSAGIPVVRSETGGFFGTKLRLNLQTLNSDIDSAYTIKEDRGKPVSKPSGEELGKAIAKLKPIPQIALKIIRIIQSDDYSLKEIALQVRHDQVISAKILKICNSAIISAKEEVKSIDQALVMLGGKMMLQLVLSSAMESFFRSSTRGYSMTKGGVYHHAVSTAIVSEHISRLTGKSQPDIAYTAGLLHDIGKVLLDQYVGPVASLFYGRVHSKGEELMEVERSLLGITHAEAGARLAELWSFPAALKDVVQFHNQPELARHDQDLTHVVYLANLLISRFDAGHEIEFIGTERLGSRLQRLGLDAASLQSLISQIPWKSLSTPGYF